MRLTALVLASFFALVAVAPADPTPAPQTGEFWKMFQIAPRPNGVEIR